LAGYFAQNSAVPLQITPICAASVKTSLPISFEISMGVRRDEEALLGQLNQEIARRRDEIHTLLLSYGIPLADNTSSSRSCK
jgi:mxaJ protein